MHECKYSFIVFIWICSANAWLLNYSPYPEHDENLECVVWVAMFSYDEKDYWLDIFLIFPLIINTHEWLFYVSQLSRSSNAVIKIIRQIWHFQYHKFSRFHKLRSTKGCCVCLINFQIQLLDKVKCFTTVSVILKLWPSTTQCLNETMWVPIINTWHDNIPMYTSIVKKGVSVCRLNKYGTLQHKHFNVAKSFNIPSNWKQLNIFRILRNIKILKIRRFWAITVYDLYSIYHRPWTKV